MARLIGLDVGRVRTGVASTDDLKLICSPLETVKTAELMAKLRALTDTHEVEGFVVGQPNLIAGTATDSTPHIDKVVADLRREMADLTAELIKSMFLFWLGTVATMLGLGRVLLGG